jgi:hypothetical protein
MRQFNGHWEQLKKVAKKMQKNKKVVDSGTDSLFSLFNAGKGLVNKT